MSKNVNYKLKIENDVDRLLESDSIYLEWFQNHLIKPKKVKLSIDVDGIVLKEFILITDHKNLEDSSYRIAFNMDTGYYGLECTLESGINWYMGDYGELDETIESL